MLPRRPSGRQKRNGLLLYRGYNCYCSISHGDAQGVYRFFSNSNYWSLSAESKTELSPFI